MGMRITLVIESAAESDAHESAILAIRCWDLLERALTEEPSWEMVEVKTERLAD